MEEKRQGELGDASFSTVLCTANTPWALRSLSHTVCPQETVLEGREGRRKVAQSTTHSFSYVG